MALRGYRKNIELVVWARQVFGFSILTITALSIGMAFDFQALPPSLLVMLS
jgi:protoheme IX farnesyltransferase